MTTALRPHTMFDKEKFLAWLSSKHTLRGDSARDVLSRAKRVAAWVDLNARGDENQIVDRMIRKSKYKLSISVRSQLRRAVKLHREFARNSRREAGRR